MPPHAIAGHLVAALTPLAALMSLAYALRPASRRGMRWPTLVAVLASAVACFVSASGGSKLYAQLKATVGDEAANASAYAHAKDADALTIVAIVLLVVVTVAALVWLAPGRPGGVLGNVLAVAIIVCALATLWLTVTTIGGAVASVWSHHLPLKG